MTREYELKWKLLWANTRDRFWVVLFWIACRLRLEILTSYLWDKSDAAYNEAWNCEMRLRDVTRKVYEEEIG